MNAPEFYKVGDYDKRYALEAIDKDFNALDYSEKNQVIDRIKKYDIKTMEFEDFWKDEQKAEWSDSPPWDTTARELAALNKASEEGGNPISGKNGFFCVPP